MKSIRLTLSTLIISALFACSSGGGNDTTADGADSTQVENAAAEDYSDMTEVNLSEYGIAASIMVPGENKGKLEMEETSWGSITLKVGDKFGIEIVPFGLTLEEMKAEMDQGGVYQIEIIEEDPNYLLYKRSIPNAEVKDEYHFFMYKEINGESYEIKSMADMELKELAARTALKAAKSLKGEEAT